MNLSEIEKVDFSGIITVGAADELPLLEESLFRNSANLLGVRQNLFTLIIAAQSGHDVNNNTRIDNDEEFGEARAVAIWWRDPYPNANGYNESFLQFFKWLEED
jgi:hypothetical protein